MFEAILTRFEGLEVAADPDSLPRVNSNLIDGLAEMPVRWTGGALTQRRQRACSTCSTRRCRLVFVTTGSAFEIVCEIEPPTRPDLMHVRHQIGVLSKCASSFLIPDNHIGRATVSSIAVAHEVEQMGGRSIACLNARDRNLLGFRRDLLTAAAYGVDQFLFVYGDRPSRDVAPVNLTVRSMIDELRALRRRTPTRHRSASACAAGPARSRHGSATPTSSSRRSSSRSTSCSSGVPTIDFDGPVYAGVMVVPERQRWPASSAPTSRSSRSRRLARRRRAGSRTPASSSACELVADVRDVGRVRRRAPHPDQQVPRGRRQPGGPRSLTASAAGRFPLRPSRRSPLASRGRPHDSLSSSRQRNPEATEHSPRERGGSGIRCRTHRGGERSPGGTHARRHDDPDPGPDGPGGAT